MPRKRSRLDIITDMLSTIQATRGEIKPTHLMYKSNMSHVQMTSYLDELVGKDFVRKVKKKEFDYIIMTDKGFEFLEKLKQMKEFEKTFGI
jgi:predicted transcriptional regulator